MRLSRSTSSTEFMAVSDSTTGLPIGAAPPDSPVPAPRGTTARLWRAAMRMQACTCSVEAGKQTGPAAPSEKMEASRAAR